MSAASIAVHQICALVEHTFTEVLPLPAPRHRASTTIHDCPWALNAIMFESQMHSEGTVMPGEALADEQRLTLEQQKCCLRDLRDIAVHYSAAIKSCDHDRETDGRKAVTMGAILCVFDATMRVQAVDEAGHRRPSALSTFMCGLKNYDNPRVQRSFTINGSPSQLVDVDQPGNMWNLGARPACPLWIGSKGFGTSKEAASLEVLTERMLFTRPALLLARKRVILYLEHSAEALVCDEGSASAMQRLFEWQLARGQSKFAVPDDDVTMGLMTNILTSVGMVGVIAPYKHNPGRYGGTGESGDGEYTELRHAAEWLCCDEWGEAQEVQWLRDVVFTYKFMLQPSKFCSMSKGSKQSVFYTSQTQPRWYIDLDKGNAVTLDIYVNHRIHLTGLTRNLVISPIDLEKFLLKDIGNKKVTEEVILHCKALPTFDKKLNAEEAESLLSFLTVPHLAIPLVLSFFAHSSRIGVLLNGQLQDIVESVLFEAHSFTPRQVLAHLQITHAPLPTEKEKILLATEHGLLLHELIHSRAAVLEPLLRMCEGVAELCIGDYTSSFVSLLLFVVRLVCRVEAFCVYADSHEDLAKRVVKSKAAVRLQSRLRDAFLLGTAQQLITQWLAQSESKDDIAKSTELHAHLVLISSPAANLAHVSVRTQQFCVASVPDNEKVANDAEAKALLCSAAYVVSWHPKLPSQAKSKKRTKRQRRSNHQQESKTKPMLRGGQYDNPDVADPTMAVPVHDVFVIIQQRRMALLRWSETASAQVLDALLGRVVECALQRTNIADADLLEHQSPQAIADATSDSKWKGWKLVSEKPLMCQHIVESEHAYKPSTDCQWSVCFPGAGMLANSFQKEINSRIFLPAIVVRLIARPSPSLSVESAPLTCAARRLRHHRLRSS